MGWMWQILSEGEGVLEGEGVGGGWGGGDQTGAKQIIGRLQFSKTIGQLD